MCICKTNIWQPLLWQPLVSHEIKCYGGQKFILMHKWWYMLLFLTHKIQTCFTILHWYGRKCRINMYTSNRKWSPNHDDLIKWKHFPHCWPFVWEIHQSAVNSPHNKVSNAELWSFFLNSAWTNGWVNNRDTGNLRRHRGYYDVTVMIVVVKETKAWLPFFDINRFFSSFRFGNDHYFSRFIRLFAIYQVSLSQNRFPM